MKIIHNKNNKWQDELTFMDLKELIPFFSKVLKEELRKSRQKHKCPTCNKMFRRNGAAYQRHVRICYKNKDRVCETCRNTGRETMRTMKSYDVQLSDAQYVHHVVPCTSCARAGEAGGKSYIR